MARRKQGKPSRDWLFPTAAIQVESEPDASLLDVVDSVLNKGAVVNGELILGVANVDLIYAKLSVLLGALDRITKHEDPRRTRRSTKRKHENPRRTRRSTRNK
jgi:gas vesicle structural protein